MFGGFRLFSYLCGIKNVNFSLMKRLGILLVIWFVCTALQAQSMAMVSGRVVSSATGERISGASVMSKDRSASVITNEDGFFTLKTKEKTAEIVVSHLGYLTERVSLEGHNGSDLVIRLRPATIQLQDLLVVSSNPRELVEAAIRRIPANYSRQPQLYHCFYRETAMKRQHFITVAEGVVDMYKTSYTAITGRDRVAILKGRRLLSSKQSDTLSVKVLGGPVAAVQLDVVKNLDFLLNAEELNCYTMQMEPPTTIGDRRQFVVSISPQCTLDYALQHGKLYIDQETLAFTRVELSLDMADRDKATRVMLVKKPFGVRFRPKELSYMIDYRMDDDGVMHFIYMRTTFRFNCDWRRRLLATSFAATCEMVVTNREQAEDVHPISGRESFDSRDAFFDKVDYFRDPDFWLDYNIIEPTESLDKAVERLLKKR